MDVKLSVVILILNSWFSSRIVSASVSQSNYTHLPKIYNFDENEICQDDYVLCKLNIKLKPQSQTNPPRIWKMMEKINRERSGIFKRDVIYRGLCLPKNHQNFEYSEYASDGLIGRVEQSFCSDKEKFHRLIDSVDIAFGCLSAVYISFIIYSTIRTCKNGQTVNRYIKIFSITETWKDLRKPDKREDFKKLRSMQGIRTISMLIIVTAHNFVGTVGLFIENPEYIEVFCNELYRSILVNHFGLIVQTFFTISSWLLAVQLHRITERNGEITLGDLLTLALNRVVRLMPAVMIVIFLHRSSLLVLVSDPLYHSLLNGEIDRCREGWWRNIFFIQNFYKFDGQICSPGTWYIAADTQLYFMVLVLFYLSQKLKIPIKFLLGGVTCITVCNHAYTVFTTDFDGLIQFTPKILPTEYVFQTKEFVFSYSRTICQLATYVIGFTFGSIYVKQKHNFIFDNFTKKMFWLAAFLGLPLITTLLYSHKSSRVMEAILAISMRPLFSLGIAVGLLGMATKTGGLIKKFFEWEPLVFLGNFTYSIYMFHFLMLFGRIYYVARMEYLSDLKYIRNLIVDIVSSFSIGILMYTILEHPFVQLQKMILPQVKTKKEIVKIKES
ncbi:hypothetical protein HHI36_002283 [Cryptolaemus montrouzieri]|uniref:Acyltransferase 3 domain-containing protein n=1 Tax=Cryptolaemus montrouzieri TaxID=559131 RepID=A0ABD2P9Z7_9CUCU